MTTIAGNGLLGWLDGTVTSAMFNVPRGVAIMTVTGDIIVADTNNCRIRRISLTGALIYNDALFLIAWFAVLLDAL